MKSNPADTTEQPLVFGACRAAFFDRIIIALTRLMPSWTPGPQIALALRPLAGKAMRDPVDSIVHGLKMRLLSRANVAERRLLFQPNSFDPIERRYMEANLKRGGVFLDVGANVGIYSLLAARLVGASGRVIAIEPQPAVFQRLTANISFNPGLSIEAVETALGESNGEAELYLNPLNDGEASLTPAQTGRQTIRVRQTTLLSILEQRGVTHADCLKIDVEGAEPLVLDPFYAHAPRALWPKSIIIERNMRLWSKDLIAELQGRGYRIAASSRLNHVLELA